MRVPQVSERIKEAPAQALRGVFAGIGQLLLITDKLRNKASAGQDVPRARTPEAAETVPDPTATSPAGQREEAAAPAGPGAAAPAAADSGTAPAAADSGTAPAAADSGTAPAADAVAASADAPATAEAVAAESAAASPATARRAPAKPTAAKPAAAKPAGARPATTRRTAAKPSAAESADAEQPKPPKRQSARNFDKTGNVRLLGGEKDGSAPGAPAAAATAPEPAGMAEPTGMAEPAGAGEAASRPANAAPLPSYDELSVASLRARLRNLDVGQVRQLADYERAHAARAEVLTMFERRIARLEAEA